MRYVEAVAQRNDLTASCQSPREILLWLSGAWLPDTLVVRQRGIGVARVKAGSSLREVVLGAPGKEVTEVMCAIRPGGGGLVVSCP
jgi:hypothetical protein